MPNVLIANLAYLTRGAIQTVWLSAVAIAAALTIGLVLGVISVYGPRPARAFIAAYVLTFRAVPVLVLMFLAYYIFPTLGFFPDPLFAVAVALAVYGAAFAAEITRGAIVAVPRGQTEAAISLGLPLVPRLLTVIGPQAVRYSCSRLFEPHDRPREIHLLRGDRRGLGARLCGSRDRREDARAVPDLSRSDDVLFRHLLSADAARALS